jgi:hypothetical protein
MHNQNKKILAKDQELFKTQYIPWSWLMRSRTGLRQRSAAACSPAQDCGGAPQQSLTSDRRDQAQQHTRHLPAGSRAGWCRVPGYLVLASLETRTRTRYPQAGTRQRVPGTCQRVSAAISNQYGGKNVEFFLPVSLCPLSSLFSFLESSWSGLNYIH